MYYIDISSIAAVIILSLYLLLLNIIKRIRFLINRIFAIICIFALMLFFSLLIQLLDYNSDTLTLYARIFFSLLMIIVQMFFNFTQIFPRWEKKSPTWFIIFSIIPGLSMGLLTVFTDLIIVDARFTTHLNYQFGKLFIFYLLLFILYLFGTWLILLYKSRSLENDSFKNQLFYLFIGTNVGTGIILLFSFFLPIVLKIHDYQNFSMAVGGTVLLLIINYSVSDERLLDFKRYYLKLFYWLTIFILLLLPSYYFIAYTHNNTIFKQEIPPILISLLMFIYFLIFFRYVRPQIEKVFNRDYRAFERNVNDFFDELTALSSRDEEDQMLDDFFQNTINRLCIRFNIYSATLFLYYKQEGLFKFSYAHGDRIMLPPFNEGSDIYNCMVSYSGLLDKSMLFTDDSLLPFKESILQTMNELKIQVICPFFSFEKKMTGLLLLGPLNSVRPYSLNLLSVLDLFRIQFEVILSKSLVLEDVKKTQIIKHDGIVIQSMKKKLIPMELKTIPGFRISSLYINNAVNGGDYFDSLIISKNTLGVFITDTSELGIDSTIISLELYTILNTTPEKYTLPEHILNMMNWVIGTSRFSNKYAPAFSLVYSAGENEIHYSNATYNPLIYYNSANRSIIELETKGIPIGIDKSFVYESKSMKASPGSIGILYSNGTKSINSGNGEQYASGRMKDIIRLNVDDSPAVLVRKIYNDMNSFCSGEFPARDISVLIFKLE